MRVEESPATRLLAVASRADRRRDSETRFLFRGPKFSALEDRSVTVVFARQRARPRRAPPTAVARGRSAWLVAIGAGRRRCVLLSSVAVGAAEAARVSAA